MPTPTSERTHGKQRPFTVKGTVTVDSSVYQGAEIWLHNRDSGKIVAPIDTKTRFFSDVVGRYQLNLADTDQTFSANDKVVVYCRVADTVMRSNITVDVQQGTNTVNFTLVRLHGGTDGLKGSSIASGKGGLHKELIDGCEDGLV